MTPDEADQELNGAESSGDERSTRHGLRVRRMPQDAPSSFHRFYRVFDPEAVGDPRREAEGCVDWRVAHRDDSISVLLYLKDVKEVVLARRFRAGPSFRDDDDETGRVQEAMAVAYDAERDGAPAKAARRFLADRAGFDVPKTAISPITTFYASPGASAERVFMFFAVGRASARTARREASAHAADLRMRDRAADVTEITRTDVRTLFATLGDRLDKGRAIDAKLLIGAQALRRWLEHADRATLERDR